jgi:hypothetical protein
MGAVAIENIAAHADLQARLRSQAALVGPR